MTSNRKKKGRKLSHEILGILGIVVVISLILFRLLLAASYVVVEKYLLTQSSIPTEAEILELDNLGFNMSLLIAVIFFVILFLFLLGERLSYIRDITKGIDAMQAGQLDHEVVIEGNNELTKLAESINYLSATQRQIREKEQALKEEKEQLIRTLSHDIRTPLTSIMAYSELMLAKENCDAKEQKEYLELIQKKSQQIKELTDILLDGGKRNLEHFEDARLLMEQLAADFEATLEDDYQIEVDISQCDHFSGIFDVAELRRIFDNLISNIQKYADPAKATFLQICTSKDLLIIQQENQKVAQTKERESYQMGLNSIRRIAHNYGGTVEIQEDIASFQITITLSDFI